MNGKKVVFSGVQPSGMLHIGNYIGALSQWVSIQDDYENIFCVVDLHALTLPENVNPQALHQKTREVAALYFASGIDPEKSSVFVQSHISAHAELTWILNCVTPVGWLERMTQYKTKSALQASVGTGLLDYPVLQAADILLYKADLVPVGEDQRQHVEITRDIAQRFNHLFGEVFVLPDVMIRKSGARVMGFDNPEAKMSKSIGEKVSGHAVGLLDSPSKIKKTIMSAVTDSGREARFEYASPGVLNLLTLYEVLTGESRPEIEARFAGQGYGVLKKAVVDVVVSALEPLQKRYAEIMSDPQYIEDLLKHGADRVRPIAEQTMAEVRRATGIG